ncbi:MAG: hypothetical protein DRR08_13750 [Candidatus Parabeggiatoa sp. nov. 2]|nr:MAG: hypothetical protein DRR08_13750 [Gammaproteobacteria bacterium]
MGEGNHKGLPLHYITVCRATTRDCPYTNGIEVQPGERPGRAPTLKGLNMKRSNSLREIIALVKPVVAYQKITYKREIRFLTHRKSDLFTKEKSDFLKKSDFLPRDGGHNFI